MLLTALVLSAPGVFASHGEEAYDAFVERGMLVEGPTADYVRSVGERVGAASGYDGPLVFSLVDSSRVNAEAYADGHIFIYRGLLTRLHTEGQLAAVLGHEVAHVTQRHVNRSQRAGRMADLASTVLGFFLGANYYYAAQGYAAAEIYGHGREFELEADRYGAQYIGQAGYDPNEMFEVIRILADESIFMKDVFGRPPQYHGLFTSHPKSDRRLYEMIRLGAGAGTDEGSAELEGDILEYVEGLAFGDVAAEGVFRDERYYHSELGMVMDFPESWLTSSGRAVISGTAPHGSRTTITVEWQPLQDEDISPEDFLKGELGLVVAEGRAIEVDTLPGYLAVIGRSDSPYEQGEEGEVADGTEEAAAAEGETVEEEHSSRLVAVIFKDGLAYVIRGENRLDSYEQEFVGGFSRTVASFRRMRREDLDAAVTTRIALVEARPEDTYEVLARGAELGREGADVLRLLNGDYPLGQPRAGDRIKIIE
jgi:predicted Zn-dependent protease